MSGKYTEAQARATKRYLNKLANLKIRVSPEEKERCEKAAERAGVSMNAYVKDAINEKIDRDERNPQL